MFEALFTTEALIALATLTLLEIVLGIDNVIFISILVAKLPKERQKFARNLGLGLALVMRIILLLSISWIIGLEDDLFSVFGHGFSGRDLILLGGGLFLIGKATFEIHEKLEGSGAHTTNAAVAGTASFASIIVQILLLDLVFSLDSVITAVGMADEIIVMVLAVIIAIGVMIASAGFISDFVNRHPTVKMLALSFLILIGFVLTAEGLGGHIDKGYIYGAMAFAVIVELLNIRLRSRGSGTPVELHPTYIKDVDATGAVGHLPGLNSRGGAAGATATGESR
ncbi:MAG TPA: TerC family protein [Thermomicrobiales bacterium]|jgi:predicted tellurium resistance membrane protein TerC|nr:TerC family protein [Thermomicrobiales bacterium]